MAQKPDYRAWFQSIKDPGERYPLDEVVYRARDGSLLEVVHDAQELRKTSAEGWKALFRTREHSTHVEYQTLIKDIVLESEFLGDG